MKRPSFFDQVQPLVQERDGKFHLELKPYGTHLVETTVSRLKKRLMSIAAQLGVDADSFCRINVLQSREELERKTDLARQCVELERENARLRRLGSAKRADLEIARVQSRVKRAAIDQARAQKKLRISRRS